MAYKGTFTNLHHPEKYVGDKSKIVFRSLWERNAFRWCDENPDVVEWASEEIQIPYENPVSGKRARYYPDLFIKLKDGRMLVVEIKPHKETHAPETPNRKTKHYVQAVALWAVNSEKWKAAQQICEKNQIQFQVWTENELEKLGIPTSAPASEKKMLVEKKRPKLKPVKRSTRPRPKRKS